jgi:hypothetical protein
MPRPQQLFAKMRTNEAGAAGNKNAFFEMHAYPSEIRSQSEFQFRAYPCRHLSSGQWSVGQSIRCRWLIIEFGGLTRT